MEKRAVIYARFSSSRQREESIEGQVRECKYFAEHEGYTILKVYADHAISGRTDDRPQFQQMIEDSHKGIFQYILVYTFDRFSRESYVSAMYKHLLKKNGVRVVSAKERTDDSPAGVLMERVFEGFAEYYSLEELQNIYELFRVYFCSQSSLAKEATAAVAGAGIVAIVPQLEAQIRPLTNTKR